MFHKLAHSWFRMSCWQTYHCLQCAGSDRLSLNKQITCIQRRWCTTDLHVHCGNNSTLTCVEHHRCWCLSGISVSCIQHCCSRIWSILPLTVHSYFLLCRGAEPRHTVVVLSVILSVCLSTRISRHSLKTKRWNLQHKQKLIFDQVWIGRISILKLSSWARRDLLTSMAVAGDLDSSEDKTVHRWLPYN